MLLSNHNVNRGNAPLANASVPAAFIPAVKTAVAIAKVKTREEKAQARLARKMKAYNAACLMSKVMQEHNLLHIAGVTDALALLTRKPGTRTSTGFSMTKALFGVPRLDFLQGGEVASMREAVLASRDEDGLNTITKRDIERKIASWKRKGYTFDVAGDVVEYKGSIYNK